VGLKTLLNIPYLIIHQTSVQISPINEKLTYSNDDRIFSNKKFQAKLSWKRKTALQIASQIREFLEDNDIYLPAIKKDQRLSQYKNDYPHLCNLFDCYYTFTDYQPSLHANFEFNGEFDTMLVAHRYSKHRMCPIWNWRKSQLIRKSYRTFINDNMEYVRNFNPLHITLTVRHNVEGHNGKEYYGNELLDYFKELRRTVFWKKYIDGGEYGLEITSGKNGLHIHLHSFCLMSKEITVNTFRSLLVNAWKRITNGSSIIHCETLYYYLRDENNNWITQDAVKKNKATGKYEPVPGRITEIDGEYFVEAKQVKKKFYIDETTSNENYLSGILECIKYHFADKTIETKAKGIYDIPLLATILQHTKNKRFYSRIGSFLKNEKLNFNYDAKVRKQEKALQESENEDLMAMGVSEDSLMGSINGIQIINPFTKEIADKNEYKLALCTPNTLRYCRGIKKGEYHYQASSKAEYKYLLNNIDVGEIMRLVVINKHHIIYDNNENAIRRHHVFKESVGVAPDEVVTYKTETIYNYN
jgi:hypothetical protein